VRRHKETTIPEDTEEMAVDIEMTKLKKKHGTVIPAEMTDNALNLLESALLRFSTTDGRGGKAK